MKIEKAMKKDVEELQKLLAILCKKEHDEWDPTSNPSWPISPAGATYLKNRVADMNSAIFIAKNKTEITGYLICNACKIESYRFPEKMAEIESMFIQEKYRSEGIGTDLHHAFVLWCKKKGITRIKVLATIQNERGIKFYKKNGFKEYSVYLESRI
jgi:GNAT superfamily N-acetyltransferase